MVIKIVSILYLLQAFIRRDGRPCQASAAFKNGRRQLREIGNPSSPKSGVFVPFGPTMSQLGPFHSLIHCTNEW